MDSPSLIQLAGTVAELAGTCAMALDLITPRTVKALDLDRDRPETLLANLSEALVESDQASLHQAHSANRDAAMAAAAAAARGYRVEAALRRRGKIGLAVVLAGMCTQITGIVAGEFLPRESIPVVGRPAQYGMDAGNASGRVNTP